MIVSGDESLIKVAFSNIIDNACKYSPDHSVNIKLHYHEKWIEVKFEDNGIGIPEEEIHKVFEPFYRASNAFIAQGFGIGLPLVNQIIKLHQGRIELKSVPGKGTMVSVMLPTLG
jgi:signal transduction histidine kinase